MTRLLKLLVVSFVLLPLTSCHLLRGPCGFWPAPEPSAGSRVPSQTFSSVEGRFRIGLPGTNEKVETEANKKRSTFKWFVLNRGQYLISYFDGPEVADTPEGNETILNNVRNLALSKRPGQVEADSSISLSGHPGRELRIRDETGTQIDRYYLAGNRLYVVSVFIPKSLACKIGSAVKVLDTFEIVVKNAVLAGDNTGA